MDGFLEIALFEFTSPHGGPADLATFANEEISRPQPKLLTLARRKVHFRESVDPDVVH